MAKDDDKTSAGHSMDEHAKGLSWAHAHADDADHDHDEFDSDGPLEQNPLWI